MKQLLASDDLEMVQLGANLLQAYTPSRTWKNVLDKYRIGPWGEVYPRWIYRISDRPMTITIFTSRGLWEQLDKGYTHHYTIRTGRGGMKLLQEAFNKFKPTKNEKRK